MALLSRPAPRCRSGAKIAGDQFDTEVLAAGGAENVQEVESPHSWDLTTAEARDLQVRLAARLQTKSKLPPLDTVAGADVSYDLRGKWLYAAVVVLRAGTWEVIERSGIVAEARFPYVPGLLSFREAPPVIEAYKKLSVRPDVLICDGQGIAHPRRLGLASHLGLWLGIPTIGCAKSRLCGEYPEPGPDRGDWSPLTDHGEVIGAVLRTRTNVKPLFVSPGHLCDLDSAIATVLAAATKYRQPITTRLAHQFVNDLRRPGNPEDAGSAGLIGFEASKDETTPPPGDRG